MAGLFSRALRRVGRIITHTTAKRAYTSMPSAPPGWFTFNGHGAKNDRGIGGAGEIGMGGPTFWAMLLRDGAVLGGLCTDIVDLDGGKLRIAVELTREGRALLIYDAPAQTLYTCKGELGGAEPEQFFRTMLADPAQSLVDVRLAMRQVKGKKLRPVFGLLLEEGVEPPRRLERRLANGRELAARLLLPKSLRGAEDPTRLLHNPPYELLLDDMATGLHIHGLDKVVESPGGTCFALPGVQLDGLLIANTLWHIWWQRRWFALQFTTHAPFAGASQYTPFVLGLKQLGDDGVLRFRLAGDTPFPVDHVRGKRVPPLVELQVSWEKEPLKLPTAGGGMTILLPGARAPSLV